MSHIVFIGGGDYRKQENEKIDDYLKSVISPEMNILIIPFATDKSKYVSWASTLFNNFKRYGISKMEILDEDLPARVMAERIASSQVLFFTGGMPDKLMNKLIEKELLEKIKKYDGILIGYSAGTLAFCKDCVVLPEEGHPLVEVIEGMGLCDFSTDVHYEESHDVHLFELSKDREIYAIKNKSAIVLNKGKMSFIGEVFLFHKGKKRMLK